MKKIIDINKLRQRDLTPREKMDNLLNEIFKKPVMT